MAPSGPSRSARASIPQRATLTANDVKTTFETLIDPRTPPTPCQRSAACSRREHRGPRRRDRRLPARCAERKFPNARQLGQLQRDHHPGQSRPGRLGQDIRRHRALQARKLHAETGCEVRHASTATGAEGEPGLDGAQVLRRRGPMVLAIQGDEVDFVEHFSVSGGKALLTDSNVQVISVETATHREMHMRTDKEPFTDKRVRQAIALSLDRSAWSRAFGKGGRTSATTARSRRSIPPRTRASRSANRTSTRRSSSSLTQEGDGFSVDLSTWNGFEIPDLAQLVKQYAEQIGVTVNVKIVGDDAAYYGDAVFGKSTWLDSVMGITDYGHRPVPNVYLRPSTRARAPGTRLTSRTPRQTSSSPTTSGPSTSIPSVPQPRRSRNCCSTRRRSCFPTSTTSSRPRSRISRTRFQPRPVSSTSRRPVSPADQRRPCGRGFGPGRFILNL